MAGLRKAILAVSAVCMPLGAARGEGPAPDLKDLEIKVWTAEDAELPKIEREVVRALQLDTKSPVAHNLLAHVLVRNFTKDPGDLYVLRQASDLAQQAVDLAPKADYGYVAMAEILDLMGNGDRALKVLDDAQASGLEPSWRFYFTRARLVSDQAQAKKVLGLYEVALGFKDSERRVIAPYVVAMLQAEAQGQELAAKLADWNDRFPTPLFELTLAITTAELGDHKRAHEIYEGLIKREPHSKEARVNDAIVLYRNLGEPARAAAQLEAVLREREADLAKPVLAMVQAHLGAVSLVLKRYEAAEAAFLKAMQVDPRNVAILDFVAKAYKEAKAQPRLVAFLRTLNDRVTGTGVAHALLGETLSESLERHDEGARAYADAIALEPGRSDYYNGMGLAYYRKKSYDQALKLFAAATEIDPNDATARYNEACVLSIIGRSDEAIATLGEALSLDPRLTRNAKTDADFANIRSQVRFRELVLEPAVDGLPGSYGIPSH